MLKTLILSSLLLLSSWAGALPEDDFRMRVSWVKSLKDLLAQIEAKQSHQLLVENESKFLWRFYLMESAWAEGVDGRFSCFYGGWPSSFKQSGSKKLCRSPLDGNPGYEPGSCGSDMIHCQPLLFGKGECVPFKTSSQRRSTFANCERKFQKKGGSYEFLRELTQKEAEDLRELSLLAGEICNAPNPPQAAICKKILQKFDDGLKSVDRAWQESFQAKANSAPAPAPTPNTVSPPHDPHCSDQNHGHVIAAMEKINETANKSLQDKYHEMKRDFEASAHCDPHKIINDPGDKPSAVLVGRLMREMGIFDFLGPSPEKNVEKLKKLALKYNLSEEVVHKASPILESYRLNMSDDERRTIVSRVKGLILQDLSREYPKRTQDFTPIIQEELVLKRIFTKNASGEIECPFVSFDAFKKALAGRQEVLKQHGNKLKHKDQISIVDYSRPSNERRMFVLDLKSGKVLHNTWVAHGGGNNNSDGVDGHGSSPEMSNRPGSNLSSDGFIIATKPSHGKLFGPNVILQGIDKNNGNLAARAVILHKWGSPYASYSTGHQEYNSDTESYSNPYDVMERVKKIDFEKAPRQEMEKAVWAIASSVSVTPYLPATQGCLGVPLINVKHLDQKGRDKSQLEVLREDLPGSIIFNYSGPDMQSKFF